MEGGGCRRESRKVVFVVMVSTVFVRALNGTTASSGIFYLDEDVD